MKVLVTSANRKIPLLRAVAAQLTAAALEVEVEVIAADANPQCVAAYAWPSFCTTPRLDAPNTLSLLEAVAVSGVDLVIPTSDGDTAYFAHHLEALRGFGIDALTPSVSAVDACLDKLLFAHVLREAGLPAVPTFTTVAEVAERHLTYTVKARRGAGSIGIALDVGLKQAEVAASMLSEPVFQPFIPGQEISVDTYRSRDGRVLGAVARTRDVIVAGESQVSTVVPLEPYIHIVSDVLSTLDIHGHSVTQVIDGPDGVQIIECNPRLGGASTLALAAGLLSPVWFAREAMGLPADDSPFVPALGRLQLVRYPWDEIRDLGA